MRVGRVWTALAFAAPSPWMCAEPMKQAMDAASANVAAASQNAAAALDALEARAAARLRALGAQEETATPPPPALRSGFSISGSDTARRAEAEEKLRLMRRQDTGELEVEYMDSIRKAQLMARQWLHAGLAQRAEEELLRVEKYTSFKTDTGAAFHLELAAIISKQGGRENEVRRLRTRVMQEANSSSLRWQAERLLSASGGNFQRNEGSANEELSKLFKMPEWQ
ncbi:hypothetical protein AB1Y20_010453 [Prymnesium parvum]|uniref:Uncharacterized protein n=1 Tax=Prymnesium parvum TaxID=97485 RepID=A0AB34IPB1_PRYPA